MPRTPKNHYITALVADLQGKIFELEGYAAVGMAGDHFVPLTVGETIDMPHGSELMYLPDRRPVLYNIDTRQMETINVNPYSSNENEPVRPVAAFTSPGFVRTLNSAYCEEVGADPLPLFSYGAVGWHQDRFRSALFQVDKERRQDLRLMPQDKILAGIERFRNELPRNQLRQHLENCALTYGCPAAKNFFIGRCEAPLPTSRQCNARCLGCLSLQPKSGISHSQERIAFTPTPQEIADVALTHIRQVPFGIVSFGQGCEGDPLLAADVIEPAIRIIRAETQNGTINMNTNGSLPDILHDLFSAGLDSIRVSMNSVREACYRAYFRPGEYQFSDVIAGIETAIDHGKLVFINYLNFPGLTDSSEEYQALMNFLHHHRIDLIQWRNLNIDPLKYMQAMNRVAEQGRPLGMKTIIANIRKHFPELRHGYFNPAKESLGSKRIDST